MCRRATAAFRIGGGGAVSAAFEDAGRCDMERFTRRKAARAPSKNRSLFVCSQMNFLFPERDARQLAV